MAARPDAYSRCWQTGGDLALPEMPNLHALCIDAQDPRGLAEFWAGVLGRELVDDPQDGITLLPGDDIGFRVRFVATQEEKVGRNRMHFDLTSTSFEEQQQTVARALELGGRHYRRRPAPRGGARRARRSRGQRVLRHRGGQQLPGRVRVRRRPLLRRHAGRRLLLERGSRLAARLGPGRGDRDPVAAGRPEDRVGRPARGARRTARTGSTSTSPRPAAATRRPRSNACSPSGARRVDIGQGEVGWVVLADPDDNEFCVLA